jgi:hypothetical protein
VYWEVGDRRRLAFAAVVTVLALPYLWASKRDQPAAPGGQVAVVTPNSDLSGSRVVEASDVAISTPAYLDGPSVTVSPAPIVIDVAPTGDRADAVGSATFQRLGGQVGEGDPRCWTNLAPFGARVVVTNTENGFKVTCLNGDTRPLPPDFVIVIDSDAFASLADLTEAPIPVELSWP